MNNTNHSSCIFAARDAELDRLKVQAERLADKVNALGENPEARLGAVEGRIDEVAMHGIRLGTTLGLAAMSTHTNVDYSAQPTGFVGGVPEDIDGIEVIIESLEDHGAAVADSIQPQSVLNRLFD